MKTVRIKLYKFNELSKEAQKTAIEKLSDINVSDEFWYSSIYDDAERIELKITGFDLERRDITGRLTGSINTCMELIKKEHGKDCGTYKLVEKYEADWLQMDDNNIEYDKTDSTGEFEAELLDEYLDILIKEYDYQTSKEAIIETIEANEYDFTKDGKLY